MSPRSTSFICLVLAAGLLICAGCTSSPEPAGTPAPSPHGTALPRSSPPPSMEITPSGTAPPASATSPASTPGPVTTTWIPKATGRDAMDEPRITLLSFVKECKSYDIPDCGMQEAFPQVAGDPAYGIRQKVAKLVMLTPEEIDEFQNTYSTRSGQFPDMERYIDPNAIGGSRCAGVPADPRWNFVRINATLIPRNARPGDYDIGINVRSHGTIVGQVRMNKTFVIEEPVIFVRYIPLKLEEMDAFDSIELVFSRRA